jgi:hypothetical protein
MRSCCVPKSTRTATSSSTPMTVPRPYLSCVTRSCRAYCSTCLTGAARLLNGLPGKLRRATARAAFTKYHYDPPRSFFAAGRSGWPGEINLTGAGLGGGEGQQPGALRRDVRRLGGGEPGERLDHQGGGSVRAGDPPGCPPQSVDEQGAAGAARPGRQRYPAPAGLPRSRNMGRLRVVPGAVRARFAGFAERGRSSSAGLRSADHRERARPRRGRRRSVRRCASGRESSAPACSGNGHN